MVEAAEATGRGPDCRSAGRVEAAARSAASLTREPCVSGPDPDVKPACAVSANPRGSGVPAAVSGGGGVGLPDFPREARALVVAAALDLAGADALASLGEDGDFGILAIAAEYGPPARWRQDGVVE